MFNLPFQVDFPVALVTLTGFNQVCHCFAILLLRLIFPLRGVNYASKSPSRQLKKECATILESMKVS